MSQAVRLLVTFQRGMCAVCGVDLEVGRWKRRRWVLDHDHATGLVRGVLCRSCNGLEAHSTDAAFEAYRSEPPAAALGLVTPYVGSATCGLSG